MSCASHSSRTAASTARWSYSPSSIRREGIRSPTCCLNSFRPNGPGFPPTARGGQVIYAIGNHDSDLAWDVKSADAVRDMTGARLCLSADLILDDSRKIRVEHGHQLDPYNCFHDPRNALDTPIGHHIVREVVPQLERLGQGWVAG